MPEPTTVTVTVVIDGRHSRSRYCGWWAGSAAVRLGVVVA